MKHVIPKNKEYFFENNIIISQTDSEGILTYANRAFFEISGYNKEEIIDQPYSILRHPDMPQEVFHKMWQTIQSGQIWNGTIKNLRKDGLYYWVSMEILPIKDETTQNIIAYMAVERAALQKDIQDNEAAYQKML